MRAARVIGRVGGLAVALGVGAAAFGGSAMAWADGPAPDSSSARGSTARPAGPNPAGPSRSHSARPGSPRSAGAIPPVRTYAVRTEPVRLGSAKRTRSLDAQVNQAPDDTADAFSAPDGGHPASVPPAPETVPLPATGTVVSAVPAGVTAAVRDSSAGPNPPAPAQSPLDPTLLAYTRRALAGTARSALPPAVAATSLVMGPSGVPIPSADYVNAVYQLYIAPHSPVGTVPQVVFTPEGLYPITGVKSLPLNTSVDQGLEILKLTAGPLLQAGDPVTVFGYSQSAIISSLYSAQLSASPTPPDNLNFVLVGNEMNPNGGFLSRFPGLTLPSLGLDFYGATPENAFPTANYTLEYDGFADFPRYPINFLADLNAGLGIIFVHTKYAKLTAQQVAGAMPLQTTDPSQKYYVIRTENLPLLEPLRLIPLIGNPLADLVQPALKVMVNLGYGDPKYGWSNVGYANVETPFGFLPDIDVAEVVQLLVQGVRQGVGDFAGSFSPGGQFWQELGSVTLPSFGPVNPPTSPGALITAVAEEISNAAASLYAALLPTADVVNAIVTMLPAYAVTLFLDGIQQAIQGDVIAGLVNAIGRPLAATVGLGTTAGLIEVLVVLQAIGEIVGFEVGIS